MITPRPPPLKEVRQDRMRAVYRPEQVQLNQVHLGLERDLFKGTPHARAGVVDPHVDAAEGGGRSVCQLSRLGWVGNVGRHRERPPAQLLAVPHGLFEQGAAPGGQNHVGAAPRKGVGGRKPDAARSASDHDHGVT